jgi:sulfur relay (sulfurtransferase) complex TusBCD TusD component (DsrE family)
MKTTKNLFAIVLVMFAASFAPINAAKAEEPVMGLFVNLTTDDTWAAAKAISFAHKKVLNAGHSPVAIWMNVRGVYLAQEARPSHVHGLMREENMSIQDMLTAFIADGGQVIMCSACSAAAGLTLDDYIDGVVMGTPDVVTGLLFDPNVKTLSW